MATHSGRGPMEAGDTWKEVGEVRNSSRFEGRQNIKQSEKARNIQFAFYSFCSSWESGSSAFTSALEAFEGFSEVA